MIMIGSVLEGPDLDAVRAAHAAAIFADGRETAGWAAKLVKNNLQASAGDKRLDPARAMIASALEKNAVFQMAARPRQITPMLFSRYETGMSYGAHVDDALMHGIRTDLSFTLFLDEPETYDGGELVIESAAGEMPIKGPAGSLFLYPSTTLHRVEPVRTGVRRVAVGWVQSRVRDAGQREILFDLDSARRAMFNQSGKSAEFDLVSKSLANLVRMWAEA